MSGWDKLNLDQKNILVVITCSQIQGYEKSHKKNITGGGNVLVVYPGVIYELDQKPQITRLTTRISSKALVISLLQI